MNIIQAVDSETVRTRYLNKGNFNIKVNACSLEIQFLTFLTIFFFLSITMPLIIPGLLWIPAMLLHGPP